MTTGNCVIDLHQTGFVGEGSDHLQLIFWPSRAPGKGVCDGAKFFGSALLQQARNVCVCLRAFIIVDVLKYSNSILTNCVLNTPPTL